MCQGLDLCHALAISEQADIVCKRESDRAVSFVWIVDKNRADVRYWVTVGDASLLVGRTDILSDREVLEVPLRHLFPMRLAWRDVVAPERRAAQGYSPTAARAARPLFEPLDRDVLPLGHTRHEKRPLTITCLATTMKPSGVWLMMCSPAPSYAVRNR